LKDIAAEERKNKMKGTKRGRKKKRKKKKGGPPTTTRNCRFSLKVA